MFFQTLGPISEQKDEHLEFFPYYIPHIQDTKLRHFRAIALPQFKNRFFRPTLVGTWRSCWNSFCISTYVADTRDGSGTGRVSVYYLTWRSSGDGVRELVISAACPFSTRIVGIDIIIKYAFFTVFARGPGTNVRRSKSITIIIYTERHGQDRYPRLIILTTIVTRSPGSVGQNVYVVLRVARILFSIFYAIIVEEKILKNTSLFQTEFACAGPARFTTESDLPPRRPARSGDRPIWILYF